MSVGIRLLGSDRLRRGPVGGRSGGGRLLWAGLVGIGVFIATWLGGRFLVGTPSSRELPLLEAECKVFLPYPPFKKEDFWPLSEGKNSNGQTKLPLQNTLEPKTHFQSPGNIEGKNLLTLEQVRSWLVEEGLALPENCQIQVSPADLEITPSSEGFFDPSATPKGILVRFTCRSTDPSQTQQVLLQAGRRLAQLWQIQCDRPHRCHEEQVQEILHQVQSAWSALALEEELFSSHFADLRKEILAQTEKEAGQGEKVAQGSLMAEGETPLSSPGGRSPEAGRMSPTKPSGPLHPPLPPALGMPKQISAAAQQENPRWIALTEKLQQWQTRRQKLLEHRTALHPEVQQAEAWIAQTEALLAQTPRWLPPHPDAFFQSGPSLQNGPTLASQTPSLVPAASSGGNPPGFLDAHPPARPQPSMPIPGPPRIPQTADSLSESSWSVGGSHPDQVDGRELAQPEEWFWLFWQVWEVRQSQTRQIVQQRLSQAQQILRQLRFASPARMATVQIAVRPLEAKELEGMGGSQRLAWKWVWVALMVALTAVGLTLTGHRYLNPIIPSQHEILSQPSPAEVQPPDAIPQNTPPLSSFSGSQPPNLATLSAVSWVTADAVRSPADDPAKPMSEKDTERQTFPNDPERQILQECIMTLEELQASVSVPVIGAADNLPKSSEATASGKMSEA